jgi:GcrA cell cycle regulator
MSWTEQQIQSLKKMWGNGFSANDIAKQLGGGLTRNAVIGKAHRLKLSVPTSMKRQDGAALTAATTNTMASITRISTKKRVMLRPLPPIENPVRTQPQMVVKEALRSIDSKRPEGIAVTKATERHCRWPVGDPRSPDFRFCGCDVYEGLPYCLEHARVAYQTISKRRPNEETGAPATPMFRTSSTKQ